MVLSAATLLALKALALVAGAAGTTAMLGANASNNMDKTSTAGAKNTLSSNGDFSDADIEYLMNQYDSAYNKNFWQRLITPSTWFTNTFDSKGFNADLAAYNDALTKLGDMPEDIDYDALMANANQAIDDENAQVLKLYDDALNRSNKLFQQELDNSNQAYNDYANQIMTNNAMSTQAIAGSTRSELDRQRRNAITRGATAAQRLVANVNSQLGLQTKAAQQQLETSNTLASALLQQRQAASQLRSDYVSNLNSDTNARANLLSGTAERKSSYRNSLYNEAESLRDAKTDQWKNRLSGYLGDSPFGTVYERSQYRNQNNRKASTYGL